MFKLLISDLDGTLWQGIAAEGKVRIKHDVVRRMRELQGRGVLTAVCSRNNPKELNAKTKLAYCNIKPQVVVMDWRSKLLQVEEVLSKFNFEDRVVVFVDDEEFNREMVKHHHPEMKVLSPETFINFALAIMHDPTEEDLERTLYTEAEEERKKERGKFRTEEEFLSSLKMVLTVYKNHSAHKMRAYQLMERTTQFNFSGLREVLEDFYTAKLEDKHGSMGVVGVIVKVNQTIKQFCLSCRVIGRGVESAFFNSVGDDKDLNFEIKLTQRNKEVVPTALLNLNKKTPWIKVVKKF